LLFNVLEDLHVRVCVCFSGHANKTEGGKEMYIFAYLPASMRAKWLTGKSAKGAAAPADPV